MILGPTGAHQVLNKLLPIRNGRDDLTWALRSSPSIDCRTSAVVDICLEHDLNRIWLYPYLAANLRLKIFKQEKLIS